MDPALGGTGGTARWYRRAGVPGPVRRVYRDIDQKRRTTRYLHLAPELVDDVHEIVPTASEGGL